MDMNLSKLQETVEDRGAWCIAVHGVAESDTTKQLSNSNKWHKDCGHVTSEHPRNECPGLWSPRFTSYAALCALCQGIKVQPLNYVETPLISLPLFIIQSQGGLSI